MAIEEPPFSERIYMPKPWTGPPTLALRDIAGDPIEIELKELRYFENFPRLSAKGKSLAAQTMARTIWLSGSKEELEKTLRENNGPADEALPGMPEANGGSEEEPENMFGKVPSEVLPNSETGEGIPRGIPSDGPEVHETGSPIERDLTAEKPGKKKRT